MITTHDSIYATSLRNHLSEALSRLRSIDWRNRPAERVGEVETILRLAQTDLKRLAGHECETCDGDKVLPCRRCGGTGGMETVCECCRGSGSRLCEACDGEGVVFGEGE